MSLIRIDRIQIRYLNVRPEPDDFIPYLTFKPYDYRHRNNHNSQPYGNTSHSNEDRRTWNLFSTIALAINTTGYKKR